MAAPNIIDRPTPPSRKDELVRNMAESQSRLAYKGVSQVSADADILAPLGGTAQFVPIKGASAGTTFVSNLVQSLVPQATSFSYSTKSATQPFQAPFTTLAPSVDLSLSDTRYGILSRFRRLVEGWRKNTLTVSAVDRLVLDDNYQQIIGMGRPALPLILEELRTSGGFWFPALWAIAGEDPVPEDFRGNVQKMTEYWLQWGRANGYQ